MQEIPLSELYEFRGHPFKVLDDEKMQETVESIKNYGVLMPGIARPRAEGGYEIIAGHRRKHGCELAGLSTMPMFIRDYNDDEATVIMVDQKKIGLVQGVDISFLTEQEQEWVQVILEETGASVSTAQSSKLKEYGKNGELTLPIVRLILTEEKPKERKVTIKADKISRYFTEDYSSEDIENIIYQLLEEWNTGKSSNKQ